MKEDAPLLFRLRADPAQWRWGLAFLRECLPGRTAHNIRNIDSLGLYSRAKLRELRAQLGLQYEQLDKGILHFYTSEAEYAAAQEPARIMREQGCELDMKTPDECVAIEPALAQCRARIVGGSMTPSEFVDHCVATMPKPQKPKRDLRRRDIERSLQNMCDRGRLPFVVSGGRFVF